MNAIVDGSKSIEGELLECVFEQPENSCIGDGEVVVPNLAELLSTLGALATCNRGGGMFVLMASTLKWVNIEDVKRPPARGARGSLEVVK